MKRRAGGLGLNIWGGTRPSKTGVFNSVPLSVRVESAPYTPHKTNWNYKLASPSTIDATSATGMLIYDITDYSSNKYDYYYSTHKGKTPNLYNFEIDWYSNDVDMEDDLAVVATKEWTSTEKYTYELPSTSITIDAIFNTTVSCTDLGSEVNCNLPMYNYEATVSTGVTNGPSANAEGILTVTYQDECGITRIATIVVSNNDNIVHQYQSTICASSLPTISYSGTGTLYGLSYSAIVPAQACSPEVPSIGCEAGKYGLSSNFGKTKKCCSNGFTAYSTDNNQYTTTVLTTTMNIKLFNDELQNPNFLQPPRANYGPSPVGTFATNAEYPDYSDIFIEIKYQTADISGTTISETQVYSYGGILTRSDYIAKAVLISPKSTNQGAGQGPGGPAPQSIPFSDDDGFKWYIVVRENTGEYLFTTLSTYMRPSTVLTSSSVTSLYSDDPLTEPIFRKLYNTPTDDGSLLSISSNGTYLVTNNTISLQANIKVIKIANFPSCGKVDIYKKKTGGITSYAGKTITSAGHGLVNGDLVKFSSAISISGVTNINGVRYTSGVTANTFDIYYDNEFKSGVPIQNLYTVTGVNWSSNGWAYAHSLYSPMGKNGYGFTPQVRTVVETGVVEGSIYSRAIESNKTENGLTRPQAYLNSWTSWNNFFPFKRIGPTARSNSVIYEEYGGTRFGSDCQISKVSDNNYILMVTEPGAELSFQIVDDYYNKSYLPANKYVIPHYLPYGRVHFYNITKTPYAITYLTSVSQSQNPFSYYETLNRASKREGYNFTTNNYDLTVDNSGIKTYLVNNNMSNFPLNEYWEGGRYYSWNRTYVANSTIGIDMPDQKTFPYEYGFLDSFGTSAAFDIESGILHCVASTYVKSADFYGIEKSRVQYVDALSEAFSIDLTTNEVSSLSGIPVQSSYSTKDHNLQNAELELYGANTDFDNKQLFMGWMSANRYPESIYIYDRVGSGYTLKQTINNNAPARGFGNYFVADNGFLVTNAYSPVDNQGNVTENTNYLYLYTQDRKDSNRVYNFTQKISPTIDLDNSNYIGTDVINYISTMNISYDNTTGNSVTAKVNLDGKYDIYGDSLVLRDYNEYAYFTFDASSGVFVCRNHHLITDNNLLTQLAVLRMRPSNASFIVENSTAEYIQSLEVLEASEDLKAIRIINQSYANPTYLPLFIKTLNGADGAIPLYANGHIPYNTGLTLITEAEALHSTGITLVAKQIEVHNSGLRMFVKQSDISNSGLKLYIQQTTTANNLNLVMPQKNYSIMPFVMKPYDIVLIDQSGNPIEIPSGDIGNYIVPYDRGLTFTIENHHTGVPNSSGAWPLYLKTYEYDDYSIRMNMLMVGDPLPSTNSNSQDLFIFSPSGSTQNSLTEFNTNNLYIDGPDFETGYPKDGAMSLVMFRTPEAELPLFVYNTYTSGNLNMLMPSANLHNSGITLYISGEAFPVPYLDSTTFYLRGN